MKMSAYHHLFSGLDQPVPLLDGSTRRYTNLDNAASTPAFKAVQTAVNDFLVYYSSVHRGTGFKSQLSTHAYEEARQIVLAFLGADPAEYVCIFGKNTTEAINKLAHRLPLTPQRNVILVSGMEHHSNDLPWRAAGQVMHAANRPDGSLDEEDYDRLLATYRKRIALVSISGASNVTGIINPLHRLAQKAHAVGALFAADCAQLAPHRAVNMLALDDPGHLDFAAISAHKLYAPFGTGALVGRRDFFSQGEPDMRGGGQVEIVTLDRVEWSQPPEREEAGSPNTVGAVALAAAICQLQVVGMETVADHEAELTAYALRRMVEVPGLHLYGLTDPGSARQRLGVLPFTLDGYPHSLLAAHLGYGYGIGVRNGCFCAHPYMLQLLGVVEEEAQSVRGRIILQDKRDIPGLVRISFGLYNSLEEVDCLVEALKEIAGGKSPGTYLQDRASGDYQPAGWQVRYEDYFDLNRGVIQGEHQDSAEPVI